MYQNGLSRLCKVLNYYQFSHWFKTVILPHRYTDIKPMIIFIGCIVVDFVGVDFFALYVILYITGVFFNRVGVEWLVYDR